MTFVVRIDLVQYTLGLSGNFNPRLVSPKYLRYIFVSLCSDNSLHLNPRLAIPKLQRVKTPTSCEIPTRKMPVIPLNRKNCLAQIGGGTFITYPTFWTSASLSHGSPLPSHPPTHSYTEAGKTREAPHPPPSAAQPEPLPRRHRPHQHLDVPHPSYRMRIRCRSGHPAGSATLSSTSKELPRRSPRLSHHLHSHTVVFTCTPEEHHHHYFLG